jgi:AcrR family transcriptional regulator
MPPGSSANKPVVKLVEEAEAAPARPRRLKRDERRAFFLKEAAKHFADHGFSSSTPELAKSLGVAQSLLYKHYKSKDELIEDVYDNISPEPEMYDVWLAILTNRSVPLRERLVEFYRSYADITWSYERVRIMMWAHLFKPDLSEHYYEILEARIFPAIAMELRFAASRPETEAPTWLELEVLRSLHGGMYHLAGFRRWIAPPPRLRGDIAVLIGLKIDVFLHGATEVLARR